MTYTELGKKLQAVEQATGLCLWDECLHAENVGHNASDNELCQAAIELAAGRAEDAGRDINKLLGENVW